MSNKFVKPLTFLVGLICLIAAALRSEQVGITTLSSARDPKKESSFGLVERKSIVRHTKKVAGPLRAKIELIGSIPDKPGDTFTVRGILVSEEDLSNVEFDWILPDGIQLINGSSRGIISAVKVGDPIETVLTLKSLKGENQKIFLKAWAKSGGLGFGASAQYNTLLQQLLDDSSRALAASTEKEATEQKAQMKQSPDRHSHRKSKTKIQH